MQNDDDDRRQRGNLIAACFVIVRVVLSIWLLHRYQQYRAVSDFILSGRHNCAPAGGDEP
jgi:hypothetical protein